MSFHTFHHSSPSTLSLLPFRSIDPPAYRGHARVFLKDLEAIRPSSIIDIIKSGETFVLGGEVKKGMKAQRASAPPTLLPWFNRGTY
jgi:hypothetical protein